MRFGRLVGVQQRHLSHFGQKVLEFLLVKAGQLQAKVLGGQSLQFESEHVLVPTSIQGELVVGEHERSLLVGGEVAEGYHGHMGIVQLASGHYAPVAGNDPTLGVGQNRVVKSKLRDTGGNLGYLRVGVDAGISRIRNQALYRPPFDL